MRFANADENVEPAHAFEPAAHIGHNAGNVAGIEMPPIVRGFRSAIGGRSESFMPVIHGPIDAIKNQLRSLD